MATKVTRKYQVRNTLIAAPSLTSSQRGLRAWMRAKREGYASGFPIRHSIPPVPQPRPKARRAATVWNGEPQTRLTLNQQLKLDKVRPTVVPCKACGDEAELVFYTEYEPDRNWRVCIEYCEACGAEYEIGASRIS